MSGYWLYPSTGNVFQAQYMAPNPEQHARPVVVIDYTDIEQLTRLADLMLEAATKAGLRYVTFASVFGDERGAIVESALREFATPPKPDEPTGLGAVVEDAEGTPWVRCENVNRTPHWYARNKAMRYVDIDAVRVLSEGVQP